MREGRLNEMALLTNLIGLSQPGRDFLIYIVNALEPEGMQMISRRERLDAAESGIFEATREHDVAIDPVPSDDERGKTHPDMKRYPCFLRKHGDWPASSGNTQEFVEDSANALRLSLEMGCKRRAATRMRLISVRKLATAFRTTPHPAALTPRRAAHF
jgi:hypothetical protein